MVKIQAGTNTANISVPISVLQPVTLGKVTAPQYADLDIGPEVKVTVQKGSETSILWTLYNENGTSELQGKIYIFIKFKLVGSK